MPELMSQRLDTEIFFPGGALRGELSVPASAVGSIVLVHADCCDYRSADSRYASARFHARGFATLAVDLYREEDSDDLRGPHRATNFGHAADRLEVAMDWLRADHRVGRLPVGLYAYGTLVGAAASIVVGANRADEIFGIAIRSGRPDLAGRALNYPLPPTLLIVGDDDVSLLRQNKDAFRRLQAAHKHIEFVPGASNGFREPGKIEEATLLASDWFTEHILRTDSSMQIAMRRQSKSILPSTAYGFF
jgi:putative phosphoribosyl transferase